jgi:LAO/AO transport system kinase
VETVASSGRGVDELLGAIEAHRGRQQASGAFLARRRAQAEGHLRALVVDRLRRQAEEAITRLGGLGGLAEEVAARRRDPYSVADEILLQRGEPAVDGERG